MVHTAPARRRKSPFGADFDLLDKKTQLTILRVIGGRDPLASVNKPGTNPNVLRFFQDPKNQRLITTGPATRRSRGFDVAANQAAVDQRIADTPLPEAKGVPRRSPGETDEDFLGRLTGSGKTEEEAVDLVGRRIMLEREAQKREATRGAELEALDRRRRAAGRPTSADQARRQEETNRILTERAIARRPRHLQAGLQERAEQQFTQRRRDEDEKRLRLGLRPLHPPQLQAEPVQVESFVDGIDLNPLDHAEGQILVNRDGEFARATFENRQRRAIPVKRDSFTGEFVIDTAKVTVEQFSNDVTLEERQFRRERVFASGTQFARQLHEIDNNRAAIVDIPGTRKVDDEQRVDLQEQLDAREARVLYQFGRTGLGDRKAPTEFEPGRGIGDIWEQSGVILTREPDGQVSRLGTAGGGELDKLADRAFKSITSGPEGAFIDPSTITPAQLQAEIAKLQAQDAIKRETIRQMQGVETGAASAFDYQNLPPGSMPLQTLKDGQQGFYSPLLIEEISIADIERAAQEEGVTIEAAMRELGIIPQ